MIEYSLVLVSFFCCCFSLGFVIGNDNFSNVRLLLMSAVILTGSTLMILKAKDFYTAKYFVSHDIGYEVNSNDFVTKAVQNNIKRHKIDIEKEIIDEKYKESK